MAKMHSRPLFQSFLIAYLAISLPIGRLAARYSPTNLDSKFAAPGGLNHGGMSSHNLVEKKQVDTLVTAMFGPNPDTNSLVDDNVKVAGLGNSVNVNSVEGDGKNVGGAEFHMMSPGGRRHAGHDAKITEQQLISREFSFHPSTPVAAHNYMAHNLLEPNNTKQLKKKKRIGCANENPSQQFAQQPSLFGIVSPLM